MRALIAMRCTGCRQAIAAGAFLRAGSLAFHPACFVCAECGQELRQFQSRHGRFYCAACFGELFAARCKVCGLPVTGRFYEHDGGQVHDACYRERVADRCDVCGGPLVGQLVTDGWGHRYHEAHRAQFPPCDACDRLTCPEIGGGGAAVGDGRHLCMRCLPTAVRGEADAGAAMAGVRAFLERQGMVIPAGDMPIRLVKRSQLMHLVARTGHAPRKRIHGFTRCDQLIQGSRVIRRDVGIFVLGSLPQALFNGIAAHELGHAWCFLSDCPSHEAPLAEGFCNYLRYLVHEAEGGPDNDFYIRQMLDDPDPAYGKGFQEMRRYAERRGFPALLAYMRKSTGIPFWNF